MAMSSEQNTTNDHETTTTNMSETTQVQESIASFTCSTGKFQRMLNETALKDGQDPFHADIYLRFLSDGVETLVAKPNNAALAYNTYAEEFFDSYSVPEVDGDYGAIIRVRKTLDYLDLVDEEGTMDVEFLREKDGLAQFIRLSGALNVTRKLPVAEEIMDRVPLSLPDRFGDDNLMQSKSGNAHTTFIDTTIQQLAKIRRAVELDEEADFYPLSVRDDEFRLELGVDDEENENRASVEGALSADSVEGEEVIEWFNTGFEEIVGTLSGDVSIAMAEDAPLSMVQDAGDAHVVRHVIGPVEST